MKTLTNIKNVITNEELEKRFTNLCESNWKVKKMTDGLTGNARQIIGNWWPASRLALLKLLNLKEDKNYKFVYHELNQEDKQ